MGVDMGARKGLDQETRATIQRRAAPAAGIRLRRGMVNGN
jgi:hypothetical protein